MPLDPEILKELQESFNTELKENAQAITNGLLALEKGQQNEQEYNKIIEIIFRSSHNIKGTARSLGFKEVGEIAHYIESIFTAIQKKTQSITPDIIDLCLDAVDKMLSGTRAILDKKPLPFDFASFTKNFETRKIKKKPNNIVANENKSSDHEAIHVPISKIDKVSGLLEEIQVNKIAIEDHYSNLSQLTEQISEFKNVWKQIKNSLQNDPLSQKADDFFKDISKSTQFMHKNMRVRINELTTVSHALQEEVGTLRMIPVSHLLCSFPRYIRDLSHQLNKEVELSIKGDELKIDKAVLEGLKDPLIHILRNAVDHGIEDATERKAKGKPAVGQINIDVKEEGSHMFITITDDGAGMDIKKIAAIAESKNLVTKEELQRLTDTDILELIFQPGFSMKEIITDVSGRGVGLDVVKTNTEDLKGQVEVSTRFNQGSSFILSVPLTISSERGLLVKCSDQYFAVPTTLVEKVLIINTHDIVDIQGRQAINLDNHTIPLRALTDILQLKSQSLLAEDKIPTVVLKKGGNAIAFMVNEVIGEREIVLKPLPAILSKLPCTAGGTLLENNQVVIVLDVSDLIHEGLQSAHKNRVRVKTEPEKTEKPHILVVDDSITTRTLEKNILESKNYQVTVAVNGKEAWDILQKQRFSLLITDVMMPVMDGFTLTSHVKKNKNLHNLPVIIVTALGSDTEKKRGIEVGADAYIVKNEFESGVLLDIVSQLI